MSELKPLGVCWSIIMLQVAYQLRNDSLSLLFMHAPRSVFPYSHYVAFELRNHHSASYRQEVEF